MNWSHDGQKDRFVIFGCGAPKMGKKSWRETNSVKVRSEIFSPGQNFLFWPFWYDVPVWHLQSAECHLCTLIVECHPGTLDSLWNFTPVVRKVFHQDFLPILGTLQPKITNRSFWPSCDQMVLFDRLVIKTWVRSFWGATMNQIFEILTWRDFVPLHQWSRKFPSRIFYPFLALHGWKLQIVLFDLRATKCCFWPACDQNLCCIFLTIVRPGKASIIRDQWLVNHFWKMHQVFSDKIRKDRYQECCVHF